MKTWLTLVLLSVSYVTHACMPPPHVQGANVIINNGATGEPLRNQKVVLKMIVYKHCAEPCVHGSEKWVGQTNNDGHLLIPWNYARSKPEVQVEGFAPVVLKNIQKNRSAAVKLEMLPVTQEQLQSGK